MLFWRIRLKIACLNVSQRVKTMLQEQVMKFHCALQTW